MAALVLLAPATPWFRYVVAFFTGPATTARVLSGAGVLIPVLAPCTGPGAGRIDFPVGVTPEVFPLE